MAKDTKQIEAGVQQLTNMTRSQVRAVLHGFAGEVQKTAKFRETPPPAFAPPPTALQITETRLEGKPFTSATQGTNGGAVGGDGGGSTGILLEDLIVVLNGTAYYTNLLTDGRLDPV